MNPVFERPKLKSILIISIYIVLMITSAVIFTKYIDRESLQAFVKNSGQWGVALYFLIEVVYVTLTPLFNTFILIASGYIFGGDLGFVLNFFATSICLFFIVIFVRKYG